MHRTTYKYLCVNIYSQNGDKLSKKFMGRKANNGRQI